MPVNTNTIKTTHKKKNTYIVKLNNVLIDLGMFELCKSTPIPVTTLNGKQVAQPDAFISCTMFPNPCASEMAKAFRHLKPVMGEKLASTVIDYLDKKTNRPVVTLFPQNQLYFHDIDDSGYVEITTALNGDLCLWLPRGTEQEMTRLNHASKQDLFKQILLRQKAIQKTRK